MTIDNNKQSGFTLIEIAVVMVIVGILLGGFIGTFSERIDTTRYIETEKQLEEIKQVLMAYAFTKSPPYLPCPDTASPPTGLEATRVGGACPATAGILPWRTLGLGHEDSWGAHYGYWVSPVYSADTGFLLGAADAGGGNTAIETRVGNANINIVTNGVAVIFSYGKNGLGAVGVDGVDRAPLPATGNGHDDEIENDNGDLLFMSHPPVKEDAPAALVGGVFDDILIWINSYEIKAKMVETGVLP